MLYIAIYNHATTGKHILLGANEVQWRTPVSHVLAKAFRDVTRELRNIRLKDIIRPALEALHALHRLEERSEERITESDRRQARLNASEAMKDHEAFLGPSGEAGMALITPARYIAHPCYFCRGMMGCKSSTSSGKSEESFLDGSSEWLELRGS
jgi:hypothetical protein